jgi:hypothetical protein
MGLPPIPVSSRIPELLSLRPPTYKQHVPSPVGQTYFVYYIDPQMDREPLTWERFTTDYPNEAVMYSDPFFNPPNVDLVFGGYYSRFVMAVRLDGSIRTKKNYGDWDVRNWWIDK